MTSTMEKRFGALFLFLVLGLTPTKGQASENSGDAGKLALEYQRNLTGESNFQKGGEAFVAAWQDWKKRAEAVAGSEALGHIDIAQVEKQYSKWAVKAGNEAYEKWENFSVTDPKKMELKFDYTERALLNFKIAKQLDPSGDYDDLIAQAEAARKETEPEFEKALEGLEWPGNNPAFAGPGDANDLAEAALKYLSATADWSKPEYDDSHTPIAACVTAKGWAVSKKNLLGAPTQYSLNVFVAFEGEKQKEFAYCYSMVFYTAEAAGVEQAPPFQYANSRLYAKNKMLMSKVEGASGGGGGGTTSGFFGLIFRVALAGALLVGGLLAAGDSLKGKAAALDKQRETLAPNSERIGLIIAIVGAACFLRALVFHLAPLTDLLPQAAAVAVGLLLSGKLEALKGKESAIGLACIALALLHLLLGGWWLV